MAEVSSWVFTICGGALICGVVSALVPGKSYEGAIQLLLGLFMLFCFLSPFSLSWELPTVDLGAAQEKQQEVAEETQRRLTQQVERDSQEKLQAAAAQTLASYGVTGQELEVSLAEDGEQSFALVRLPERCRENHALFSKLLETAFGLPVQVEYYSIAAS